MKNPQKPHIEWIKKYLRLVDYIGASQIYLKDNFLLEKPLEQAHLKTRPLGHWGTVPGLNLIFASLNYLITKEKCEIMMITGPGHGAPAILANEYIDGTIKEYYPDYTLDKKGFGKMIKDFSWPYTVFPSHVTPSVPGSILEGGELGYSLSTAFGAVLDNPNLIVATVVGDGEAESGPLAAAWHSNKFLNPATSGAVLPIIHLNSFKISNPTILASMSETEITELYHGLGYNPIIVKGPDIEEKMIAAVERSLREIRSIQKKARKEKEIYKPRWPMIVLKSLKGWKGPKFLGNMPIENSFHSHGVPLENSKTNKEEFEVLKKWLESYKINELVDKNGKAQKEIMQFVPKGDYRIGMNQHAYGGEIIKDLKLPASSKYETRFKDRGQTDASAMEQTGKYLAELFKLNKNNFRFFCPDEFESNKLSKAFTSTKRAYVWPIIDNAEEIAPDGRIMEILSEHTLQGWMQGYLLTGRHGILSSYEAFTHIISSMVDQHAKFIKQSKQYDWRQPIASAIYIETSVGWRQDHNGFSHQNPSFVSNILQKHGEFCQIYYPADANSMIIALEETLKKKNSIFVIVADKRPLPQWLSMKEAREQGKTGIGIWEWVGGREGTKTPDVVLASAGDHITHEAILAVKLCHELVPELKIRYVNVSELTALSLGDNNKKSALGEKGVNKYFTENKSVVFSYHGYTNDIEQILWPYANPKRFSIHGYKEQGSTTTPFDLKIRNGVSRYQLAQDLIMEGAKSNKSVEKKKSKLIADLQKIIVAHTKYIKEHGDDPDDIKQLRW